MSSRSIRRIAAATLVAGTALGAAALPASAQSTARPDGYRSGVVISDVQSDFRGFGDHGNRSLNREWVDVTNTSRHRVNLDGWTLSDRDGHTYTFRHYRLDGRATVRVHTGVGRDTYRDLFQDRRTSVWDRRSDTATLRNDHGRYVDSASVGDRHHRDHDGDHRGDRGGRHGHGH